MVGALAPSGPGRVGRLPGRARAASATPAWPSSTSPPGSSRCRTPTAALWLVFNGEIFNYVELARRAARRRGPPFRTRSDTEVIVQAWRAWGDAAFARFNGQFACAIWEPARRTPRARPGPVRRPAAVPVRARRPAVVRERGQGASSRATPSIPRAFDPVGLAETFTFWATSRRRTVFAGITELEPGHVRTITTDGATDERRTGRPVSDAPRPRRAPLSDRRGGRGRSRAALERAVRLRMLRADVPGRQLPLGRARQLAHRRPRPRRQGRPLPDLLDPRSTTPSTTRPPTSGDGASASSSDHHELVVTSAATSRRSFRTSSRTPSGRSCGPRPRPCSCCRGLVRDAGIKVVLTGEGADEMFAGYDLFREGKVRRFWGRQPDSSLRPRLLERLYPYLERSPVAPGAMARSSSGATCERWAEPGFAHGHAGDRRPRSSASSRPGCASAIARHGRHRPPARLAARRLRPTGPPSARTSTSRSRTLLSGYLLSSQGDRMLMAHSVEGRFPFLDTHVVGARRRAAASIKLRGLDEKHVLKRVAPGPRPGRIILSRPKQPYRAPDALAFVGPDAPGWVDGALMASTTVSEVGVFDPAGVARLWRKCRAACRRGRLSNADNMALVGVLSTGLLHQTLHRASRPDACGPVLRHRRRSSRKGAAPTSESLTHGRGIRV